MNFSGLTTSQRVTVLLELLGGPKFAAGMKSATGSVVAMARANAVAGEEAKIATRRTWLQSQAVYTLKRFTFLATLSFVAFGAAIAKWGVSYLSALQNARVALTPVVKNQAILNSYLTQLFQISKFSPFVIKDIASAFRVMFATMQHVGISGQLVLKTIRNITDYLSYTGKTAPGDLNRVTQALSKMANLGRLTGQTVRSLGSVGIPIYAVLSKYFHVTRDQLAKISSLNLNPRSVLAALNAYAQTNPGIHGAAVRNAFKTFSGTIGVARDTLSQISGNLLRGSFGGGQGWLFNLVKPGGALDKISNLKTGRATVFGLSKMLTGGTLAGSGFLLIVKTLKDFFAFLAHVIIPAFLQATIVLAPLLILVKALDVILVQLNKHTWLLKWPLTVLIGLLILWRAEIIAVNAATRGGELLGIGTKGIKAWYNWATAVSTVDRVPAWKTLSGFRRWSTDYANQGILARLSRGFFQLGAAVLNLGKSFLIFLATDPIGWAILLVGALVILYWKWKPFRDLVNKTFHELIHGSPAVKLALILAFGPLALAVEEMALIIRYWKQIKNFGSGVKNTVFQKKHSKSWEHQLFNPFNLNIGFATGGLSGGGMAMVGERGPEMVNLPGGSRIIPNNQLGSSMSFSSAMGGSSDQPIIVQVMLDRKVLAEGVARATRDKKARR